MNDNNSAPLKLDVLYSEAFLQYLSLEEMGKLRQVNKELYNSSRLKNTLVARSMHWIREFSSWSYNVRSTISPVADNPDEIRKILLEAIFKNLTEKYYNPSMYSFYLFLGGKVPFESIKAKAKQERRRNAAREFAICTVSGGFMCCLRMTSLTTDTQACTSLIILVPSAIFCLSIPPCFPYSPCAWLTYTGAATLGTTVGGTTLACLEKRFHIFTFCCEPYNQLKKMDEALSNHAIPARIAMLEDEPAPVQAETPVSRSSLVNCFRGLFEKRNTAPNELSPLVPENHSSSPHI
ncbi:MAG: hypothetical protein SFW07_04360 [Gammaproteobacteria bacterium]|nr:hypothetical protein [Gammaproteobacteria bacterium]